MSKHKKYCLYVLMLDKKPVYVGISKNPFRRSLQHKIDGKNFDRYHIIKSYDNKKEALAAENSLIRFNGLFDIGLTNAKHTQDVEKRIFWDIFKY